MTGSKIQSLKKEAFDSIADKLDEASRSIKSAKSCLDDGEFFQAAVRVGGLSHNFTEIEMTFFEILSEDDND